MALLHSSQHPQEPAPCCHLCPKPARPAPCSFCTAQPCAMATSSVPHRGTPARPSTRSISPLGPCTLHASSPRYARAAGPTLARWQPQSRSYLALIKNIPRRKEPKGHFLPAAPGWRGFEGCRPRPVKRAAHRRLRLWPDCGSSAPRGLFLAPVKKEKLEAGRCQAGPPGSGGRPGRPPPAPLARVPLREGDGRLAPVPAPVGNNKRDADPRAP